MQVRYPLLFALLCLLSSTALAQMPDGSINGLVKDPGGRVVPGVRVAATSDQQATERDTATDTKGVFVLPDVAPGTYTVTLVSPGFAEVRYTGVAVEAGKAITLDTALQVAQQRETVTVVAGGGAEINQTQSALQGEITQQTINTIPLNGRNFLELSFLIPGNRPAPNFDPTKTNTVEVSSVGGYGRGSNIMIDGGDNNDEVVGGTLTNLPEDSVAEFQIATARYSAEGGRSGNSVVNIITRGGTDLLHGSLFVYERNRNIQARPATLNPDFPTPPFDREQFGGTVGGPIVPKKLFFFSAVEYRNQNAAIQTGTRDFATDTILNTAAAAPLRDLLQSNRLDYNPDAADTVTLRYSYEHSTNTSQASPSSAVPQGTAADRQNALNRYNSAVLSWTRAIRPNLINVAAFHYDDFFNDIPPFPQDQSTTNPPLGLTNELIFPDLADGANFNLPQDTHLNRFELRDAVSWVVGNHSLSVGGEFQHYRAAGEINVFGTGIIVLTSDFGFADLNGDGKVNDLDIPIAVALHSTAPVTPVPIPRITNNYTGVYVQDDIRARSNLTFNLGLRYEYDSDATGQSSAHGPCPTLTVIPTTPCTWMANILGLKHPPDTKDFGPRLGFVYDPWKTGQTVFRGGYGIYYDRVTLEASSTELVQNDRALTVTQYAGSECTNPSIPAPPSLDLCFAPGSMFVPGTPTLANAFSGPHQTGGIGIEPLGTDTHHPMFQQFSFGLQQQVGAHMVISADGLHNFGNRLLIGHLLRQSDVQSPYLNCPGSNQPCTITDPATGITDGVTINDSSAKSWYDGLLLSLQHQPVQFHRVGYSYNISYTLSKTLDYSDDDQLINSKTEAVNIAEGTSGLAKEKGYAIGDERHRFVFYGEAKLPWQVSIAPLYTFSSGVPADTFLTTTNSRLPNTSRNALGREIPTSNQLNLFINAYNNLPQCPGTFPCKAGASIANVPANINFSSPFSSFDLRLRKNFQFGERFTLGLIGESFNLFNQVNVLGVNNSNYSGRNISIAAASVNPVQTNFYQPTSVAGGFFGTGGPRAFQFAARLEF